MIVFNGNSVPIINISYSPNEYNKGGWVDVSIYSTPNQMLGNIFDNTNMQLGLLLFGIFLKDIKKIKI